MPNHRESAQGFAGPAPGPRVFIPSLLRDGGKLYISHAKWFDESEAAENGVAATRWIEPEAFDLSEFGWIDRESGAGVFPIVEVMRIST